MKFGLTQHIIDGISSILEQYTKVDKAFIFGSRAKGNYRPDSDIDIAITGQDITYKDITSISVKMDDLNIGLSVDLLDYHSINEPALKEHIDRVGIEFYSRWKEFKLGDIADITSSKRIFFSDYVTSGIPFYRSKEIIEKAQGDDISTDLFITEEKFYEIKEKYGVPQNGDILISAVGERAGIPYCVNQDGDFYFKDGNLIWFRNFNSDIYSNFLVYYFNSSAGQQRLESTMIGSAQKALTIIGLKNLEVAFPPFKEQTTIASILASLDDKIDLLHRQNKTLEQLAEMLFRQWFVEEAEESWEFEKLGKVFDIGIGRTPPRKEQHWFTLNPKDVKWVSIKDMGTSGIYIDTVSEYLTLQAVEQYSVPVIPENTVLLSFKMTIGRLAISTEKMVSNEAIAHFKQKEGSFLFPEFLYLFLKTYSWVELGSTSSIVESINSQMIKDIEIAIPEEQKLNAFKDLVKPYFDKIRTNQTQIRTLTQTRDTLLPKLMSGEVRVEM